MKIELPDIPYELLDTLSSAEVPLVQAYARQAVREFVEGQKVIAGIYTDPQNGARALMFHQPNVSVYGPNVKPLIIKPELDDADNG